LLARLARADVVTVQLPGFGCARPDGFGATKEEYVAWLIAELEKIATDGPIDLVGHDWGALLVQRVVSLRPDLIRTWACGDGPIDRDYVWHDLARQWQTAGVGEAIMAAMSGDALADGLAAGGVPAGDARDVAARVDERMKECILGLYRSAIDVGAEWQAGVERVTRPALVLWSRNDPYVEPRFAERLAARVRGELVMFEGCGHWWPYERPRQTAEALLRLWSEAREPAPAA
jgi:pimeloyl-ACP methyl ester carboxylesterase